MKVRVYFCREIDPQIILKGNKISKQTLNTIYELVWECEFKNILNVGRVWLKFREEEYIRTLVEDGNLLYNKDTSTVCRILRSSL